MVVAVAKEDEAFKKNKIDPLKKRHSLRMVLIIGDKQAPPCASGIT
jgi:hypothetical protein